MSTPARNAATYPPAVSLAKLVIVGLMNLPMLRAFALPLSLASRAVILEDEGKSPEDASLWLYLGVSMVLVLLGGLFAGLTIAYVLNESNRMRGFRSNRPLDSWDKMKSTWLL